MKYPVDSISEAKSLHKEWLKNKYILQLKSENANNRLSEHAMRNQPSQNDNIIPGTSL